MPRPDPRTGLRPVGASRAGPQLPDPGAGTRGAAADARRILAGGDYRRRGTDRSLIQRIEDWIKRHLPHLHPGHSASMPKGLSVAIVVLLAVGLIVVIVWGIVAIRRGRRSRHDEQEDDSSTGDIEITPLRSTDQWRAEAERLEAIGQWREALRARYRSVIGLLIDRHLLDDLPGRTPGEHRVELAEAAPKASPPFDAATSLFEAAWFGDEPTDEHDLERFRALADAVSAETVEAGR